MSIQLDGIDHWREYFQTAKADIFEIIERGILVAASDCPNEFKLRRERIAELLFSTRLSRCTRCDLVGLSVPELGESGGGARVEFVAPGGSKESKAHSVGDDETEVHLNPVSSNYSYGEAEALTDEIEEEALILEDVLRIKEVFSNFEDESDSVLFESLRRLQLMRLTVSILKATEIGKTVNGLRKHDAKQIRHLARELIGEWKATVDEYMETVQESKEHAGTGEATPDSINPSVVEDEEDFPFPPMDDCAFFTTQNIDFAQFFDGMDDDGNPRTSGELNNNQERGRRPPMVKPDVSSRKEQPPKEKVVLPKEDKKVQQPRKQELVPKPSNKPLNPTFGPGRPVKPNGEQRVTPTQNLLKKSDKPNIPRRPAIQPEKLRCLNEDHVQEKIEATKRRLQESYQEVKDAKKQRTIQVMELRDLPKQGLGQRNPHNKFGNPNRKLGNTRR